MLHMNLTHFFQIESTYWQTSIEYNSNTLHDIIMAPPNMITPLNNIMLARDRIWTLEKSNMNRLKLKNFLKFS
jgi:hypothetical protein